MYYEYSCPVGLKEGKHRHKISGEKLKKTPRCCYCGAEMTAQMFGSKGRYENSEATGHKWMLFGTKMPDAPVVAEIKRPRKKAQAKGEAGMLDGYVNPTDELKGGIERMAVNA